MIQTKPSRSQTSSNTNRQKGCKQSSLMVRQAHQFKITRFIMFTMILTMWSCLHPSIWPNKEQKERMETLNLYKIKLPTSHRKQLLSNIISVHRKATKITILQQFSSKGDYRSTNSSIYKLWRPREMARHQGRTETRSTT